MSVTIKLAHPKVFRWLVAIALLFFAMACALRDLGKPVVEEVYLKDTLTEQAYRDTQDSLMDTAWSEAYTQDAQTKVSSELTASPTNTPPRIIQIYVPPFIAGTGDMNFGQLEFADPNGDVNRLTVEVLEAVNFGGADYDPSDYIYYGDEYNGVIRLYLWCEGQQVVTLRYTLYDRGGNRSNSADATFECR